MTEEDVHRTGNQARAGTTPHVVRYILAISLALVILAYIVILLI
jgi:hypothetical protein